MPGDAEERYTKQLVPLSFHHQSRFTAGVLLPLLEHKDPKVRTLTLVGLFALEDPFLLPHIAGLVHDESLTFPEPVEQISRESGWPRCVNPTMRVQTVGSVAQRMIRFYAERSREGIDFREAYWEQTWAHYYGPRAARGSCAGWHLVIRDRRYGGRLPIYGKRKYALMSLFYELERDLPPVDQELILLLLYQADYAEAVGKLPLIRAARRLGPDRLTAFMEGNPETDDPDIRPGSGGPGVFTPVRAFNLRNAGELLRPSDAERLLVNPDPWIDHLYPIARAELLPEQAGEILHAAFDGFDGEHDQQERAETVRAIARTFGVEEREFLVAWLYTEPDDHSHCPPHRNTLVEFLVDRWTEGDRRILAAIVKDPRFLTLDQPMVEQLGRQLDRNLMTRLFAPCELDGYVKPEELEVTLADWRRRIRASLPDWEPTGD